jgi:hypothetical protein
MAALEFFLRDVPSNYARPLFDEGRAEALSVDSLAYEVHYSISEGTLYTPAPHSFLTRGTLNTGSELQYFAAVLRFTRIVYGVRSVYLEMANPFPIGVQFAALAPLELISQSDYELDRDRFVFPRALLDAL